MHPLILEASDHAEDLSIHPLFHEHASERLHQSTNPILGPIGEVVVQRGEIRVLSDISDGGATYQWSVRHPTGKMVVGGATHSPEEAIAWLCYELVKVQLSEKPLSPDPGDYTQEAAVQALLDALR